jgi:hypothetical protein
MEINLTLVELTLLKRLLTAQLMQSRSENTKNGSNIDQATLSINAASMSGSALRTLLDKILAAITIDGSP